MLGIILGWICIGIIFGVVFTGLVIDLLFHRYEDDGISLP